MIIYSSKMVHRGDLRSQQAKFSSIPKSLLNELNWVEGDKVCFYASGDSKKITKLNAFKITEKSVCEEKHIRRLTRVNPSKQYPLYFSSIPSEFLAQLKWSSGGKCYMISQSFGGKKLLSISQQKDVIEDLCNSSKFHSEMATIQKKYFNRRQTNLKRVRSRQDVAQSKLKKNRVIVIEENGVLNYADESKETPKHLRLTDSRISKEKKALKSVKKKRRKESKTMEEIPPKDS